MSWISPEARKKVAFVLVATSLVAGTGTLLSRAASSTKGVVKIDLAKWRGKSLATLGSNMIPAQLQTGKWLLLVGDSNCSACARFMDALLTIAESGACAPRLAYLNMGAASKRRKLPQRVLEVDGCREDGSWRISGPVVVYVDEGVVVDMITDTDGLDMLRNIWPG
jgi:hypothetical protein